MFQLPSSLRLGKFSHVGGQFFVRQTLKLLLATPQLAQRLFGGGRDGRDQLSLRGRNKRSELDVKENLAKAFRSKLKVSISSSERSVVEIGLTLKLAGVTTVSYIAHIEMKKTLA